MAYVYLHQQLLDRYFLYPGDPQIYEAQGALSIFSLPNDYCQLLNEEINHWQEWRQNHNLPSQPPNSMHSYGITLEKEIFYPLLKPLVTQVIKPFGERLYYQYFGDDLDEWYGFITDYSSVTDQQLPMHVDASHITFNLCLTNDSKSGELVFYGQRCIHHMNTYEKPKVTYIHKHEIGRSIMHTGLHRHGVLPIHEGSRRNLILWCRNSGESIFHDSPQANYCCEQCS